ncbi:hypothetical protein [Dolichospermum circinale]|jgi:predicted hydrocarbon binding protein|uniref:hypothetical protein n=1 Tax=Dolichospermum circinale TaxID=109265 RepID=UPI00232E7ABC|nr:hypothetical protein [Dolichospermum circinale]MDB9450538.1 hypothetical protein [Dolichospermum circinale CS-547]
MPLPIKDEIKIVLTSLAKLMEGWNNNTQVFLSSDEDKVKVLETILGSLYVLRIKLNDEIDKLTEKIGKEIAKEKKKTKLLNVK